ncbi:MAG: hypothetical protein R2747_17055 [Pyrinomonadaceae bacterium]
MRNFSRLKNLFLLVVAVLSMTACDDDFYLSEHEVRAYESIFVSEYVLNTHFDNLQGRSIQLNFNNPGGTPQLQSTNLLSEMRRTELADLENGEEAVSLDRLAGELETQIGKWVGGKLDLYAGGTADKVRLTRLDSVEVVFLTNPKFKFNPDRQLIEYEMRLRLVLSGEIEVKAVNWLINLFTNINGTYPLEVTLPDLALSGEARLYSPYSNAGRVRFQMLPRLLGSVQAAETGISVPTKVKRGVEQVLTHDLSRPVDEVFLQEYDHFTLPDLHLTPGTAQTAPRLKAAYRSKADWLGPDDAHPQIHVVSRGTDGRLYHARKGGGGWSDYRNVPVPGASPPPFTYDPTLIHSGRGQLELAAVNGAGELFYSHWRDDQWGNVNFIRPNGVNFSGRPAVAASAPGQAEIFVAGSDGRLWHLRRVNGFWSAPVHAGGGSFPGAVLPIRDPVAVSVGNKVVVIFADSQKQLFAVCFDLETGVWGKSWQFRTSSNAPVLSEFAPAAVASGEERVDVVYVKPGGAIFHQALEIGAANFQLGGSSNGISFRDYERQIPGSANAAPVLTAASFQQPELFVRGNDDRLYHNHFVRALSAFTIDGRTISPGWQNWTLLDGFLFADTPTTDARFAEFAAAGTRGGKTEVIARARPKYANLAHLNFHNEFESDRFGRPTNPWKTVHWRGWEAAGRTQFLGRPAAEAVDGSFQTAHIGNRAGFGSTVHTQRIGETERIYSLGAASPVRMSSPVTDPVIISTGPGIFDTFAILQNGKPEHTRHYSGGTTFPQTLNVPAGVVLTGLAASAYGNGFVDLAASSADRKIYFWRFRGGVWSQPTVVADQVISAPILLHVGAGQIELLAVDSDHTLFRWRFAGNAWQPRLSVENGFFIDNERFSGVSASSWGDGTVDLVAVELNSRKLHHRRIGPGVWNCTTPGCPPPRAFRNIGGVALETPVLTAFSPTRLNVLTMQGLRWYSSWGTAIQFQPFPPPRDPVLGWTNFQPIGGDEMIVGGSADTGPGNFAAIAVREGEFFINRNERGRWTGFRPVTGQKVEQIIRQPVFLPAITARSD